MTSIILSVLLSVQAADAHVPKSRQPAHSHHHRTKKPKRVDHLHWVWISGHWEIRANKRIWVRGHWSLRPEHRYLQPGQH